MRVMICTVLRAGVLCGHVICAAEVLRARPGRVAGKRALEPLHLPFANVAGYEVQIRRVTERPAVAGRLLEMALVIRAEDLGVLPF
jgi:hypothetical protein